jgi:hypothetical protein
MFESRILRKAFGLEGSGEEKEDITKLHYLLKIWNIFAHF